MKAQIAIQWDASSLADYDKVIEVESALTEAVATADKALAPMSGKWVAKEK